jgi:hypothetical protein
MEKPLGICLIIYLKIIKAYKAIKGLKDYKVQPMGFKEIKGHKD